MSSAFLGELDTIGAIATPLGTGGIAVIRVSGPDALSFLRPLAAFLPDSPESHRVYYGHLRDLRSGEAIDEVLVSYFGAGRSFTGEETLEISCHGGRYLTEAILESVLESGVRLARPGEFTYRAFMNGRIDLSQAEGVLALIESQSKSAARMALRQLQGALSERLGALEDGVIWVMAQLEANIDFAGEDIVIASNEILSRRLESLLVDVREMLRSYTAGRVLRDGFRVAIVGAPNAGKSSLLNRLLGFEKAIVSSNPGTTRDPVEGAISIGGIQVVFFDTAGIRETEDFAEREGIRRSQRAIEDCDLIWFIRDIRDREGGPDAEFFSGKDVWLIENKVDLFTDAQPEELEASDSLIRQVYRLSAITGAGISTLLSGLEAELGAKSSENNLVINQARHFELLTRAEKSLDLALKGLRESLSPELLVADLNEARLACHEILGKSVDDQVLDRVFNEFCLGK